MDKFQKSTIKQDNKAFIFDMDGVIVDSENAWIPFQDKFSTELFGKDLYIKMGASVAKTIDSVYKKAQEYGFSMNINSYYNMYDKQAKEVYKNSKITHNINKLILWLKDNNFKLGLVSSSRLIWINFVLEKVGIENQFDYILSLNDRKDLKSKPSPDGYIEAIKELNVKNNKTVILEDSNSGIKSAKKAGAITIGFQENITDKYIQKGADYYAQNTSDVISIVSKLF